MNLFTLVRRRQEVFIALALLCAQALPAHEGHDHAEEPPPQLSIGPASRAASQSELFELVAVQDRGRLLIYLDHFADNSPATGARLEVESGSWKAVAPEIAEGSYAVDAPVLEKPGRHPLTFKVVHADGSNLLRATLTVSDDHEHADAHDHHPSAAKSVWIYSALALPLAAAAYLFVKRRSRSRRAR